MSYMIKDIDLELLKQKNKVLYSKCVLINSNYSPVRDIEGYIISGSYNIDSDSLIRRTCNLEMSLQKLMNDFDEFVYFTHYIDVYIGIYHNRTKDIIYYKLGRFGFDNKSYQYDITTNTLSLSLVDQMGMLGASQRGVLYGASTTRINALADDGTRLENSFTGEGLIEVNGEMTKNSIKNAIGAVCSLANVESFDIEEIGAYSVASLKNKTERQLAAENFYLENGYNYYEVPYNLEFQLGSGYSDMLAQLISLYPNYECYFDVNGMLHANMIPSKSGEPNYMEYYDIQDLVISESMSNNIYDVKNVIEIWGKELTPDNYSTDIVKSSHTGEGNIAEDIYTIKLNNYISKTDDGEYKYSDGLIVGGIFNSENTSKNIYLNIESTIETESNVINYGAYPVYNPYSGNNELEIGIIQPNTVYLFQWSSNINSWYYLGQYQVHGLAVLTDGSADVNKLSEKYNCNKNAIYLNINPDSPYCIEKIGEVVGLKTGEDYQNINSDLLAKSNARYELWKSTRRQDTINIECIMIPFLDVNTKISYIPQREIEPLEYIVKSISGSFDSGTMSIELMRYYPLYEE